MPDWRLWLPPALEKPRVRIYASGHIVSVLGDWFQQVALSWLIYRLSGDVFLLGLSSFLLNIPYLLLSGVAGSLTDRVPRLRTLIAIDLVLAAFAAILAIMVAAGVTNIVAYLTLAGAIGTAKAFEMPLRQSLFVDIVEDKRLLPSAIALSALLFNVGRMLGPALAGGMLLYVSEAWCFAINALSFAAIIYALLAMKLPARAPAAAAVAPRSLRASFVGALSFPAVRYLLPTVVALGICATPYLGLMPSIVATFFDGKPSTLGALMGSAGAGALVAALYLALQPGYQRQLRLVTTAPIAVGLALLAFAWSRSLPLSMALLLLIGASLMMSSNTANALLQQSVPDEWRGRVIGLYAMAFAGTAPIGNLLAGALASHIGLTATLSINAGLVLVAVVIGRYRLHNHPEGLRSLVRSLRN